MKFVLSERSRITKRLANTFFFKVWKVLDDLGSRHAVRDQIHT